MYNGLHIEDRMLEFQNGNEKETKMRIEKSIKEIR